LRPRHILPVLDNRVSYVQSTGRSSFASQRGVRSGLHTILQILSVIIFSSSAYKILLKRGIDLSLKLRILLPFCARGARIKSQVALPVAPR
jgi:hypothetical protein